MQWSPCGRLLATVCRDTRARVFNPREGSLVVESDVGVVAPKKGARVIWALNGEALVITGFSRQSERQV